MGLSILIPTYNYDCTQMAHTLLRQGDGLSCPFEVIVGDDGSTDQSVRAALSKLEGLPHFKLFSSSQNLGRSAIRNQLGRMASNDNLLFLDSDGEIISDTFLADYCSQIDRFDVVCGGIIHSSTPPSAGQMLRYAYEKACERQFIASKLNNAPNPPLRSFNFMIRKDVFLEHPFDEGFTDYGYEDVLFGKELRSSGHSIHYIDNPMQNNDIETNEVFLSKTEEALRTLKKHEKALSSDVRLLRVVKRLHRLGLSGAVRLLGKRHLSSLHRQLCEDSPDLRKFNLYKLFYYLQLS